MNIGERLIQIRKEHNYTREALAEVLGISKFTLRNYELGVTDPGHPFLIKVADLFNTSIDYILGLTNEPERLFQMDLKSSEIERIKKFRVLDSHGKEMVDLVLDKEHERCLELKKTSDNIISIEKPAETEEPDRSYLMPVAAHDDYIDEEGEMEKVLEDLKKLQRPK